MKPIFALASLALGAGAMTAAAYVAFSPNAFLTRTPRVVAQGPALTGHRASAVEPVMASDRDESALAAFSPIRITGRRQVVSVRSTEEKVLTACSDWRSLGPSATRSAGSDSEHKVKLLCPAGATAQQTFMAEARRPEPLNKRW